MLNAEQATEDAINRAGLIHRVCLPADGSTPLATVLLVHGRAGDARVMWTFSKVLEGLSVIVVSPQAPIPDPIGGHSWWLVEKLGGSLTQQSFVHDVAEADAKLQRFVSALPELYGTDLSRIIGIGFSQGAALLLTLALQHPDRFVGVASLAGFLPSAVMQSPELVSEEVRIGRLALPPIFAGHGTEDKIIPLEKAERTVQFLRELKANVTFTTDPTGHKVGSNTLKGLGRWIRDLLGQSQRED